MGNVRKEWILQKVLGVGENFFWKYFENFRAILDEWILQKVLRVGENFFWKYFDNFRAILDKL